MYSIVTTLKNGKTYTSKVKGMKGVRDFTKRFANEMELLGYFELSNSERIYIKDIITTKIMYTD